MKKQFEGLLDKEMDRKHFLKYTAAAGLMAIGGGMIAQSLAKQFSLVSGRQTTNGAVSYGASTYGGTTKPKTKAVNS